MNLFELFAKISLDTGDYEKKIGDVQGKTSTFATKLKSGLATAAKAATAAISAAATGIVAMTTKAVQAYGDYEQLVGGVETLFKGSADTVQRYAANAYKTAGMSANDYMETVTSFSASLLQSLGGDTAKAASAADTAIRDMSDNANKMGSDMQSIQNAYAGFSKGQFNMLDNLKLGYGGTKEEMQRLLADAEKLSGVKYDISSLSDVYDAIHVVQTEMGITGTTAKEASETIQGSAASMKAAWQNMLTAVAGGTNDFSANVEALVETTTTFARNIIPVISTAISGIGQLVEGIAPVISEQLPALLEQSLPPLIDGALSLVDSVVSALPAIAQSVVGVIPMIAEGLLSGLPTLAGAALSIVTTLATGIGNALPTLIPAAAQAVTMIVQGLADNISQLIDSGLALIQGLADGLLAALPVIIAALPEIIESIVNGLLEKLPDIIETGVELLSALVKNLPVAINMICAVLPEIIVAIVNALMDNLPAIISAGVDLFIALIKNLPTIISTIVTAVPAIIAAVKAALVEKMPEIQEKGRELLTKLKDGITEKIEDIKGKAREVMDAAKSAFEEKISGFTAVGKAIVDGIKSGISNGWKSLTGWVREKAQSLLDAAKSALGIASPSKKFRDEVGKMMAAGIGLGFEMQMPAEIRDIQKALDFPLTVPTAQFTAEGGASGTNGHGANPVTIIQNIYSQAKTAAELARETRWEAEKAVLVGV